MTPRRDRWENAPRRRKPDAPFSSQQGDAAIDQILDAIETVYGAKPATGLNRVEHATMARADQIERMKKLGCEPSFMTDFVYLYGADYRDDLFGAPRAEFMVPVGAAAKAGIGYSLHTDNPAVGLRCVGSRKAAERGSLELCARAT